MYVCTIRNICNQLQQGWRVIFLTKEKLVVGVPHSNFRTVANCAVRTYEPKFILYIDKYTYLRIHIPRPLPLRESSPNIKVRKKVGISKINIHTDILLRM